MRRIRDQRGAVAVMTGILSVVLLVFLALVADYGMAYAQRQAASTGADAASLAIVQAKYKAQLANPSQTCPQILTADNALASGNSAKSTTIALNAMNQNAPFNTSFVAADLNVSLSCVSTSKVLQAKVTVTRSVNRTFGKVIGSSQLTFHRTATSALAVRNKITGIKPIALCQYQAQTIIDDAAVDLSANHAYRAETIALTKVWTGNQTCDGSGGAGNWGWLDLGQGNGASALGDEIVSGSSTPFVLTGSPPAVSLNGTPGNKGNSANTRSGMSQIMDQIVTLPVYTTYTGNGNNASYTVNGFLTVRMCGFDSNIKGACFDPTVPMGSNEMQVKFVSYTSAGNLDTLCGIGASCAYDSYVTGLVS